MLTCVFREHDTADLKSNTSKAVDKAQNLLVVGDTYVASVLVVFNIVGGDSYDYFRAVLKGAEHRKLGIGLESGEDSGRVVVVKELAAKLQIELAAKLVNALSDVLRLHCNIFFVVET